MTNAQLADLARFGRLPEGKVFVDFVKMRLAHHDAQTRIATGEEVYRSQGRAQALDEVIKMIEGAEANLARITGSKRPAVYAATPF